MARRGMTLMELLVGMVVMAIIGTAVVRMIVSDARFVSSIDAMMNARQTARAAMNTMVAEMRMVSNDGLLAAARDSVTVRVPYAFGMACNATTVGWTANRIVAILPTDSVLYWSATPEGLARRIDGNTYQFTTGLTVTPWADPAPCTAIDVSVVPGGWLLAMTPAGAATPGDLVYFYETVTYRFAPSTLTPGSIGLWRRAGASPDEEVLAPFDTSAKFAFVVDPDLTITQTVPVNLAEVEGLELILPGVSENPPQGQDDRETFELRTVLMFMNRGS